MAKKELRKRVTIGTDPEFFLIERGSGKLISAIPHIAGTKHEPEPLPCGGSIQRDNVAVEFATVPAVDGKDFVVRIREAFMDVMGKIGENHELAVLPSAHFDRDQLEDEEAKQFGCDPDFNAWTVEINVPPSTAAESTFRSCGAHIHVGHVEGDENDFLIDPYGKLEVVKTMDCLHGVISIILDDSPEAMDRKKLYGKAGCHRPTDYGVEYRVLSNFWLKSPHLVMLMDALTQDALALIRDNKHTELIALVGEEEIQNIINNGQIEEAKAVLEKFLRPILSEDSLFYLEECLKNVKTYDFKKEWEMEGAA